MKDKSNKIIAKNTMFLYVRSILLMMISFYTSRVVLQSLGVEDYGIYNVVGGIVVMFQMLSSTLAGASQRFITYALGKGDKEYLKKVFSTSITLHLCLAVILFVLIEVVGGWLLYNGLKIPTGRTSIAVVVLQFSIATLFINIVSIPFNAAIIAHERMKAFAYISILEGCLKLVIALLLFWSPIDKLGLYACLMFVVVLILRIVYGSYSHKHFEETNKIKLHVEPELFGKMFAFSGWNLLGNGSKALRNEGVDILLNTQFGVTVNAAKGIANQVDNAIYQFVGNFQTAVNPQITKSVASGDIGRCQELVFNASRYSFLMLSIFVVPIMITIDSVLDFWLTTVPSWSATFIRLTFIYLLCETMSRLLINSLLANGVIRNYQIVVAGTKFLALPICFVVLKFGGNPATGIMVNIFLELVCVWERLFFNKKYLNFPIIKYVKNVIVRCWVIFGLSLIIPLFFNLKITNNFFLNVFVSLTSVIVVITIFGVNRSERMMCFNYLQKIIKNR